MTIYFIEKTKCSRTSLPVKNVETFVPDYLNDIDISDLRIKQIPSIVRHVEDA